MEVILILNKLKMQKKQLEDDIEHLKITKRIITKTTGCDFCILEYHNHERDYYDIQNSDYHISLLTKTLDVCRGHMEILKDSIEDTLINDNEPPKGSMYR